MLEIPLIDIRGSSLVDVAKDHSDKARGLIESGKQVYGTLSYILSKVALPIGDKMARNWLHKTKNPYAHEIDEYAKIINIKGIHALNLSYEWGCTSAAFHKPDNPVLLRVLDWPFPALGESTVIAHQKGSGGEFYNVTWPGVSGIFQAMAPGRFSAAINQAPMRRHMMGLITDWVRNRHLMFSSTALPPAHLLRKVFEEAKNYSEAKEMLTNTPIALPVFYILTGTKPGEGCVIERLENDAVVRELGGEDRVATSNHFMSHFNGIGKGWLPRATNSSSRFKGMMNVDAAEVSTDGLEWFKFPIANHLSKLVMYADSKTCQLTVQGTEGSTPVTKVFSIK